MKLLKALKNISNIDKMLADKYNQETVDIQEWLILTEWSKNSNKEMLNNVQNQLFQLTIIDKRYF
jgi:hypothetical protein